MLRTKSKTPGRDWARPSRNGDSRARSAERAREAKRELARRANAAETAWRSGCGAARDDNYAAQTQARRPRRRAFSRQESDAPALHTSQWLVSGF